MREDQGWIIARRAWKKSAEEPKRRKYVYTRTQNGRAWKSEWLKHRAEYRRRSVKRKVTSSGLYGRRDKSNESVLKNKTEKVWTHSKKTEPCTPVLDVWLDMMSIIYARVSSVLEMVIYKFRTLGRWMSWQVTVIEKWMVNWKLLYRNAERVYIIIWVGRSFSDLNKSFCI